MIVNLAYGRTGLKVEVPDRNLAAVLQVRDLPAIPSPERAILKALQSPIQSPSLAELADGKRTACIVAFDITRPVPHQIILPPILKCLERVGIASQDITLLIATGTHRPNSKEELVEMFGRQMVDSYRIINHDATDSSAQAYLGETSRGTPVWVNRSYTQADLKILTGLIEPHMVAGYSGGRKAICPGICGMETIQVQHGPKFIEPEQAANGILKGNPFHQECLAVAKLAGADFIVNVTIDEERRITGIFSGDLEAAHLAGCRACEQAARCEVPEPVPIVVISSAGYPLDSTFYQTVKGMVTAWPIVKPGGTIIIASACSEGIGGSEFGDLFRRYRGVGPFLEQIWQPGFFARDQWQVEVMCKVLRRAEVYCYSEGISSQILSQLWVTPLESVEQGIGLALKKHGPEAKIVVIPQGPYVMPVLANG